MRGTNKMGPLVLACVLGGFAADPSGATNNATPEQSSTVQGGELCNPGDDCPIEGQVCCPHTPGPEVPFTCSSDPCFRGGELCNPGDECPVEGQVCCPHAPGPTPFTCDFGDCFR